ncbi:MAG: DinB family protein [Chloroflexota bacterium]|nr:DinB family protein [Chloroflexota bacterium]
MDQTASSIIERETALADFDHARDDFVDALSQVPNEALKYKPEGADYPIGGTIMQVTNSLRRYAYLLEMLREAEFQEVRLAGDPGRALAVEGDPADDWAQDLPSVSPEETTRNRQAALDALEAAHDRLAAQLRDLVKEDFSRQAAVYHPGATETSPTSGADILRWQTDHYRDHILQVQQMLQQWQSERA